MTNRPGAILSASAFLFDLDGTLIDSGDLFDAYWVQWAERQGADPQAILAWHPGKRLADTVAKFAAPGVDCDAEVAVILAEVASMTGELQEIPGAGAFLRALPPDRWGIVTSSFHSLTRAWLRHLDLPIPAVIVTGEDVTRGKPAPDPFLLAAEKLGVAATQTLVFEDAVAGIAGARAAGAAVVALATTQTPTALAGETWISDYRTVTLARPAADGRMRITLG